MNIINRSNGDLPTLLLLLGFIEHHVEYWSKELPVDMLVELHQRIFELGQFFKEKVFVKKAEWVDVCFS